MPTSRVKTALFPTFEIAVKWQNVLHTTILQADFFKSANKQVIVSSAGYSSCLYTGVWYDTLRQFC